MGKLILLIGGISLLGIVLLGGFFFWQQIRGLGPAFLPPPDDIADIIEEAPREGQNNTEFPLQLPAGFSVSVFAKDLPGVRVMALDALGNMWVSQTREGKITLLQVENGKVANQQAVFQGLNRPHGLAFHPQDSFLLYFAEENGVSRVRVYSEGQPEELFDLPEGGNHFTRTILFAPDGRLLTSVGSTCNVCQEEDWRRASVLVSDDEGNDVKTFAKGLRNAVFMATHYVTGDIWVTEMGRDHLGDDLPPDEINVLQEGKDYGWPYCYGENVSDPFGAEIPGSLCIGREPSHVDLQAHSAPLGLAFVPEEGWPEEYWYDLLVAYHGSWNRSIPTGYKIMRIKLDAHGNYEGREDFITGWLQGSRALGRPVDILVQPGGVIYISDDKAGVIWYVEAPKQEPLSFEVEVKV